MYENEFGNRPEKHPVVNLIIIILMVGLGFVIVGPIVGFFLALPFYEGTMMQLADAVQQPLDHPELKVPLYIIQGSATAFGLIFAPMLFLRGRRRSIGEFFNKQVDWLPLLITAFIVIIFMVVNSVFIEWNLKFNFPDFANEFENWAREREDAATELTTFLTQFDSRAQLFLAILIIAVLPAIGEEIVFRGLIQNELMRGTANIHLSIWFAAFLFSAIHMQFFGFVPRLLLGALFGYLYYWSGNLMVAIFAHFVNNGVSVLALYFYQQGTLNFDLESPDAAPPSMVMISGLVTAALLYFFYKYYRERNIAIH